MQHVPLNLPLSWLLHHSLGTQACYLHVILEVPSPILPHIPPPPWPLLSSDPPSFLSASQGVSKPPVLLPSNLLSAAQQKDASNNQNVRKNN